MSRKARRSCLVGLLLLAGPMAALPGRAGGIREPSPKVPECARCQEIDQRLRRGEWAAAEEEARTEIADQLKSKGEGLVTAVILLAVSEQGQGRTEDAFRHWQVVPEKRRPRQLDYGEPGELLTKTIPRFYGQAPAGLVVRREGDGGKPLTAARRFSGDDPQVPDAFRRFPLGIRVEVIVDTRGRVLQPVVAASTFSALSWVVLEAMQGWRFTPAQAAGKAVASFYELRFPAQQPLDRVVDFGKSPLTGPLALLAAGRYAEAERRLDKIWESALRQADRTRGFLGVALALKALAEAGLSRDDAAICRFQAAQTMEPRLFSADLSAFGAAGTLLMSHPWTRPEWDFEPEHPGSSRPAGAGEVKRPEIVSRRWPVLPDAARHRGVTGRVVITSIITETGALQDSLSRSLPPPPALTPSPSTPYATGAFGRPHSLANPFKSSIRSPPATSLASTGEGL